MKDLPIEEIKKLHLEEGDIVLIKEDAEHRMPRETAMRFYEHLKEECFSNNKLIILPSNLTLDVVKKQQLIEYIDKLREELENE